MLPVFLLAPAIPGAEQDTLTQPHGSWCCLTQSRAVPVSAGSGHLEKPWSAWTLLHLSAAPLSSAASGGKAGRGCQGRCCRTTGCAGCQVLEFPALEREGRRTLGIFCSLEGECTRSSDRTPLPLRDDVKQRSTEEEWSHQPLPHPPRGSDTEISLDSWRDGKKGLVLPALPVSPQHRGWPREGAAAEKLLLSPRCGLSPGLPAGHTPLLLLG